MAPSWLEKFAVEHRASDGSHWKSDSWINRDNVPLPPNRRTWNTITYACQSICGGFTVSGWTTGSSLLALGLNVWQAMLVVIIGNALSTAATVSNGLPGGKWHVGFSVLNRAVWGIRGSFFTLAIRIVLSFTWYACQTWYGAKCLQNVFGAIFPQVYTMKDTLSLNASIMDTSDFIFYVIFCVASLPLLYIPPEFYKKPFMVSSVLLTIAFSSLFIYSLARAHGGGPLLTGQVFGLVGVVPAKGSDLAWAMVYGISSTLGGICAGILNSSDFTRFAVKPGSQIYGQSFANPISGCLCAFMGIICTSVGAQYYPDAGLLWTPYALLQTIQQNGGNGARAAVFFLGCACVLSQFVLNVSGNAIAGGIDLASCFPRVFNIRRGAYLTAAIAVIMQPWQLLNGATRFLSVVSAFAVFLGPATGLMLCDYIIVRKKKLRLTHLYIANETSIYWEYHGVNLKAVVAWVMGVWPLMPGFGAAMTGTSYGDGWLHLYQLCWPAGAAISAFTYYVLCRIWPSPEIGVEDPFDYYGTFGPAEVAPGVYFEEKMRASEDDEKKEDGPTIAVLGV